MFSVQKLSRMCRDVAVSTVASFLAGARHHNRGAVLLCLCSLRGRVLYLFQKAVGIGYGAAIFASE